MQHATCPHCGSERLRESHLRGISEQIVYIFGGHIRRCRRCRARLLAVGPLVTRIDGEGVDAMTTVVPLLCLAAILWTGMIVWLIVKVAEYRS